MKIAFGILGVIVFVLALSWIATGNDFFLYKYFAPKQAQVQREVFEQTKSYNQGTVQQIRGYMAQYIVADSSQRDALASVIIHETADYDENKLPQDCRDFLIKIRKQQLQ
jgi:hypothetical protein